MVERVFLLRPQLRAAWDPSVHLNVPAAVTLERAVQRAPGALRHEEAVPWPYARRDLPAQALYRAGAASADVADVVLDDTDPTAPPVLRWPGGVPVEHERG